jgi:hypothetical protein
VQVRVCVIYGVATALDEREEVKEHLNAIVMVLMRAGVALMLSVMVVIVVVVVMVMVCIIYLFL